MKNSWACLKNTYILFGGMLSCFIAFTQVSLAAAPNITGSINIEVSAGNIINASDAPNSVAQVAIASVSEGSLANFDVFVAVGDVTNTTTGDSGCSQVLIGSVGVPSCIASSN